MPVMYKAHVRPSTNNYHPHTVHEPVPTVGVLTLHKCKGQRQNLIIPINPNSSQDLSRELAGKESAIDAQDRPTMLESFDTPYRRNTPRRTFRFGQQWYLLMQYVIGFLRAIVSANVGFSRPMVGPVSVPSFALCFSADVYFALLSCDYGPGS
jgi:hypothetical protein